MKFNDKIVCNKVSTSRPYHVAYALYESKTKRMQIPKPMPRKTTNICFSGLIHLCRNSNRMYYKPRLEPDIKVLTKTCAKKWVALCVENRLLPEYVQPSGIDDGFVLNLNDISPCLLYVYLCTIRFVEEEPDFVRSVVYLVSKEKMNMYAAIVFGTMLTCSKPGHHYFQFTKQYGVVPNINRCRADLKYMISLKRFVENPKKYDKRLVKTSGTGTFMGQYTIEPISKVVQKVKASNLYSKHILAAINSKTDEEALEHIEAFRKESETEEIKKKTKKVAKKKVIVPIIPVAKRAIKKKVVKKKVIRKRNLK